MKQALWIALGFAALRAFFAVQLDLAPDEAYYWEWAQSPALAYYDQGPGLSLAIRFGTFFFGDTEFGVRFVSLLSGVIVTLVVAWICIKGFGAPGLAPWMALAFNTLLLYAVGGLLMMHDSLLVLFWALALACGIQVALGKGGQWWLGVGASAGLGLLSKHSGAMLFGCLFLLLAFDKRWRAEFRSPWLWAGLAIGLCGALPILIWNAQQGWPSFQHVGSLAGGDPSRRSWGTPLEFLASQAGLATPLLFYIALWGLQVEWKRWRGAEASKPEALMFFTSAPVFAFFLLLSFRTRVEGNWPAPAWLGALLLGGGFLYFARGMKPLWLSRGALIVAACFSSLAYAQAAWPFLPIPQKWEKLDTAARVDGWKELGERVRREGMPFTACRTYQNAAECAFYAGKRPLILQDGVINHQYRFWNDPKAFEGGDFLLVTGQDWEAGEMVKHFKKYERLPDEVFLRNGIEVRRTRLYKAWGFKAPA